MVVHGRFSSGKPLAIHIENFVWRCGYTHLVLNKCLSLYTLVTSHRRYRKIRCHITYQTVPYGISDGTI